jgi:hypothetical protein
MRVAIFVAVLAAHIVLIWLFPSLRRLVLLPVAEEAAITAIFLPPVREPEIALPFEPAMDLPLEPEDRSPWLAPLQYRSNEGTEGQGDISKAESAHREVERLAQQAEPVVASPAAPGPEATPKPEATAELNPAAEPSAIPGPNATVDSNAASDLGSQLASLSGPPPANPDWRAQAESTAQTSALQIVEAEDSAARRAAALTAHFKPLPGPRVRGREFGWDYAPTHRITHAEGGGFIIALNDRCAIFIFLLPMIGCSIGHQPPANGDLFKYMHKPVKFGDWDWRLDDP